MSEDARKKLEDAKGEVRQEGREPYELPFVEIYVAPNGHFEHQGGEVGSRRKAEMLDDLGWPHGGGADRVLQKVTVQPSFGRDGRCDERGGLLVLGAARTSLLRAAPARRDRSAGLAAGPAGAPGLLALWLHFTDARPRQRAASLPRRQRRGQSVPVDVRRSQPLWTLAPCDS